MKKLEQAQQPLYAIAVPRDAKEFKRVLIPTELNNPVYWLDYKFKVTNISSKYKRLFIGTFKFEIVGTATKDHIDFDVTEYVESKSKEGTWTKMYRLYDWDNTAWHPSSHKSFRSLLTANGIDFNDGQKRVFIKPV